VQSAEQHAAEQRAACWNSFFPATSTLQQAPYEKTMVKSKKKQPVAGVFGKVRKHVVPRTRAQRQNASVAIIAALVLFLLHRGARAQSFSNYYSSYLTTTMALSKRKGQHYCSCLCQGEEDSGVKCKE